MVEVKVAHGRHVPRLIRLIARVRQRVVVFTRLAAFRITITPTREVQDVRVVKAAPEEIVDAICVILLNTFYLQ